MHARHPGQGQCHVSPEALAAAKATRHFRGLAFSLHQSLIPLPLTFCVSGQKTYFLQDLLTKRGT